MGGGLTADAAERSRRSTKAARRPSCKHRQRRLLLLHAANECRHRVKPQGLTAAELGGVMVFEEVSTVSFGNVGVNRAEAALAALAAIRILKRLLPPIIN